MAAGRFMAARKFALTIAALSTGSLLTHQQGEADHRERDIREGSRMRGPTTIYPQSGTSYYTSSPDRTVNPVGFGEDEPNLIRGARKVQYYGEPSSERFKTWRNRAKVKIEHKMEDKLIEIRNWQAGFLQPPDAPLPAWAYFRIRRADGCIWPHATSESALSNQQGALGVTLKIDHIFAQPAPPARILVSSNSHHGVVPPWPRLTSEWNPARW